VEPGTRVATARLAQDDTGTDQPRPEEADDEMASRRWETSGSGIVSIHLGRGQTDAAETLLHHRGARSGAGHHSAAAQDQ
jgi:hypothetical protein